MENICANCEHAFKRQSFDFKKYGSYHCPYECSVVIDRTENKKADDTCPLFSEKEGV